MDFAHDEKISRFWSSPDRPLWTPVPEITETVGSGEIRGQPQVVTCSDILSAVGTPQHSTDLLSACLQADAAIQAARMQAAATTNAGWLTVGTGVTALVAAFIAYLAAGRQVRLTERQYQARRKVYASLIYQTLHDVAKNAEEIEKFGFSTPTDLFGQDLGFAFLAAYEVHKEALSDRHWERHAMLDADPAMRVVDVYTKASESSSLIEAYGRERKRYLDSKPQDKALVQKYLADYETDIMKSAHDLRISAEHAMDGLKVDMQKS